MLENPLLISWMDMYDSDILSPDNRKLLEKKINELMEIKEGKFLYGGKVYQHYTEVGELSSIFMEVPAERGIEQSLLRFLTTNLNSILDPQGEGVGVKVYKGFILFPHQFN